MGYQVRVSPPGAGFIAFDALADLAAFPAAVLVAGLAVYVVSPGAYYNYQPLSAAAPNGSSVITAVGGGRWILGNAAGTEVFVSVQAWGADPTGAVDSKAAIQAALNAVAGTGKTLVFDGTFITTDATGSGALTLSSNTSVHFPAGSSIQRTTLGAIFISTGANNVIFSGAGTIAGPGGSTVTTSVGISFTSCYNVVFSDGLQFTGFPAHAISFNAVTDSRIGAITVYGCSGGVILTGCKRIILDAVVLRDPSTTAFCIGFFLNSTDGQPYGYCTDITYLGCKVKGYNFSQDFMMHAGERIQYIGCEVDDGLIGFEAGPFVPGGGSYTSTAANFTQPAVGGTVIVQVGSTSSLQVGQWIWIVTGGLYFITNLNVDGIHMTVENTGFVENAVPTTVITQPQLVLAGDVNRGITYTGCQYRGSYTGNGAGVEPQVGILLSGSTTLPVENVSIAGGNIDNGGFNQTVICGGIQLFDVNGIAINGITIDRCYGSGISILGGVTDLSGGNGVVIRNVLLGDGRQVGINVSGGGGNAGHMSGFTVDGATTAVSFDSANGPQLGFDDFQAINCTNRAGGPQNGCVDGTLYKVVNATTVTLYPWVKRVLCDDTALTTVTQPVGSGYIGQEVTYFTISGGFTSIDRSNCYLASSATWGTPGVAGVANRSTLRLIVGAANTGFEECRSTANG